MTRDVFILGAGFSLAVNSTFPNTDQLGELVRSQLPEYEKKFPAAEFRDGRFEEWLSYLAERQPHHDEWWTLESNALEIRVTQEIQRVLAEVQRAALQEAAPKWFYELLSLLHVYRASVITFNYDNLVECGVETMGMTVPGLKRVGEEDILGGLPKSAVPAPPQSQVENAYDFIGHPVVVDDDLAESFRLMKLHGSLTWYWLPNSGSGSSLRRWRLPGLFSQLWSDDNESLRRELPRHEVFVVPPSMLKGERLREPVARELWHRAATAVAQADRLVLIGYSVPVADHSFSGLLTEGLGVRAVQVEIVNPQADQVRKRLVRLGVPDSNIVTVSGPKCVERWVTEEIARASGLVVQSLRAESLSGDELMYVANPRPDGVPRVERSENCIVVHVDPPGQVATQPQQSKSLLKCLDGATSMVVRMNDRSVPVVDYWLTHQPGYFVDQLHFFTAGR